MTPFARLFRALSLGKGPSRRRASRDALTHLSVESLECRALLAVDFGDAPDKTKLAQRGDYQTTESNAGPSHLIDSTQLTMYLGGGVDADDGTRQSANSLADDLAEDEAAQIAFRNDEDAILFPNDLQATVGATPVVRVRATNLTGVDATLAVWLDLNRNGVFENDSERVTATVKSGTNNEVLAVTLPVLPYGSAGVTYLRMRLSSDVAALNPTGRASNGEVEDHRFVVLNKLQKQTSVLRSTTVGDRIGGGPDLDYFDAFGWDSVPVGDINRDGIDDLVVSAPDDSELSTGAIYVLMMNTTGTVKSYKKIASRLNGGPLLAREDYFGTRLTSLGDIDGDGTTDIAVGASGDDTGGLDRGAVYIVRLTPEGTAKNVTKIASGLNGGPDLPNAAEFGSAESIGDINHDGRPEILVGAPFFKEANRTTTGAVFLLSLNADGTSQSTTRLNITESASKKYQKIGEELAFLGDINGDGTVEFASLSHDSLGTKVVGRNIDIMSVTSDGLVTPLSRVTASDLKADWLEVGMISAVGDVNGDGIIDLGYNALDVYNRKDGFIAFAMMSSLGTVTKIEKLPSFSGPRDFQTSLYFYASLSALGDLNSDGSPEFVLSMPGFTVDVAQKRLMGGLSVVSVRGDLPKTARPGVPSATVTTTGNSSESVFRWAALSAARSYEIWLRNDASGEIQTKVLDADVLLYKPSELLPLGTHSFKIRAINELGASNWSPIRTVKVNPPVTLKAVPDQFLRRPRLSWHPVAGADQYTIRIYDRKSGKLVETATLNAPVTTYVTRAELPGAEYEFDVMAASRNGTQGAWSPRMKFRTEKGMTGGIYEIPVRPQRTIWFSSLADAASYELQIVSSNTGTVVRSKTLQTTTYILDAEIPAGNYVVRVRPVSADGVQGAWSSVTALIVPPPVTITSFPQQIDLRLNREVRINWTPYPGVSYYSVHFRDASAPENPPNEHINWTEKFYMSRAMYLPVLNRFGRYEVSVAPVVNRDGKWVPVGLRSEPVLITAQASVTGVSINPDTGVIKWAADIGASEYQVNIVRVESGREVLVVDERVPDQQMPTAEMRLTQTLPLAVYRVRVRPVAAPDVVGIWSTDTEFLGNTRSELVSPDSRWISRTPTLQWLPVDGATSYRVVIRTGTRVVADFANIQGTSYTPPSLPSMESYSTQQFEWAVSANLGGRNSGVWSASGVLRTAVAPQNVTVTSTATGHNITWSKLDDADRYELYIADSTNKTIAEWSSIRTPQWSVSLLKPGSPYRVWVRAIRSDGTLTRWSGREFTA